MKTLLFALAFCFFNLITAQNSGVIEGKLFDKLNNSEPILFANVAVKGADISSITDYRGNYVLKNLSPGNYTLQFSFLGYETKEVEVEVTVNGIKQELDVYLETTAPINFENIELVDLNN